jgi:5,10-methylene-tetrahydrofolate dehydrogenase/methenyl tetrahydrofolate cyclohydrolase
MKKIIILFVLLGSFWNTSFSQEFTNEQEEIVKNWLDSLIGERTYSNREIKLIGKQLKRDVVKRVEEVEAGYKVLEKENFRLKETSLKSDSSEYSDLKIEVKKIATESKNLMIKWIDLEEKIRTSDLFTTIASANNPTSDGLGFNFVDVITNIVDKTLTETIVVYKDSLNKVVDKLATQERKNHWKGIVSRILNNDIVKTFAASNPITSIASSIITSAIGQTNDNSYPETTTKGNRNFITTVSIKSQKKELFQDSALIKFNEEIKDYVSLYLRMDSTTVSFKNSLTKLKKESFVDSLNIINFRQRFLKELNLKEGATITDVEKNVNKLFQTKIFAGESPRFKNYREVLDKPEVVKLRELSKEYYTYEHKTNFITNLYYKNFASFVISYKKILQTTKKDWKKKGIAFSEKKMQNIIDTLNEICEFYIKKGRLEFKS